DDRCGGGGHIHRAIGGYTQIHRGFPGPHTLVSAELDGSESIEQALPGQIFVVDGQDARLLSHRDGLTDHVRDFEGDGVVRRQNVDVTADDSDAQCDDAVQGVSHRSVDGPTCHRAPFHSLVDLTICRECSELKIYRGLQGPLRVFPEGVIPCPGTCPVLPCCPPGDSYPP